MKVLSPMLGTALLLCFLLPSPTLGQTVNDSLLEAARNSDTQKVKAILDQKADINSKSSTGRTALMIAAMNGQAEIVKLLLDRGADVQLQDSKGQTARQLAVQLDQADIVKLLDQAAVASDPQLEFFDAVKKSDTQAARRALDKGADVNAPLRGEKTALMIAAAKGPQDDHSLLRLLLERGAMVNASDKDGKTAFDYADLPGKPTDTEAQRLLMEKHAITERYEAMGLNESLRDEVRGRGDSDMVGAILNKMADPNYAGKDGIQTVLMIAAEAGNLEIVNLLLKFGANPNRVIMFGNDFWQGKTALFFAAEGGHTEVVKSLIEKGANVNVQQKTSGLTPLMMAAQLPNAAEIVTLLIKAGSEANATNRDGDFPLSLALKGQTDASTIKALLDGGADVDLITGHGEIPLMLAAGSQSDDVVAMLADRTAKPRSKDFALLNAALKGRASVAEILLKKGANPNAKDDRGYTVMFFASRSGDENLVRILEQAGAKDRPARKPDLSPVDSTSVTRASWRKLVAPFNASEGGATLLSEKAFKSKFGQPTKTQRLGDEAFWYYQCSDGLLQVVVAAPFLQQQGVIINSINEY